MFFAIGLLVPQPRLIAISLWHQRKLPYWCTLVWNSHQLIPNKAYSPQGRLLRKRRDSVFRCGYDCTPLHPGPQFWGGTHASQRKPSTYCRLSSTKLFRTPGARRQDWVLGTMGFALHRDANFSRFKLILVEIATTRLIQRRVISYRLLYIGWRPSNEAILNRKFVEGKCLNRFLYIASPIIHLSYIYIITYFFEKIKFIS